MSQITSFILGFYWFLRSRSSSKFDIIFSLTVFTIAFSFKAALILTFHYLLLTYVGSTPSFARFIFWNIRDQDAGLVAIKIGLVTLMANGLFLPFALSNGFFASVATILLVYALVHNAIFSMCDKATHESIHSGSTYRYRQLLESIIFTASVVSMTVATLKIENAYVSGIWLGVLSMVLLLCAARISDVWIDTNSPALANNEVSLKNRFDKFYSF
jgi:hypothetical protein